jgi:phosphohistidine phosphatase
MKSLYLIRHAKSSWEDVRVKDFDRPLNERGHQDAPSMAAFLKSHHIQPDIFISSPALRAKTTCEYFSSVFGYPNENILFEDNLYEAMPNTLYAIIHSIDNQHNTVFMFGHNPSISMFMDYFLQDYIPEVPTCGILKFELSSEKWADFLPQHAIFKAMWEPKKIFLEKNV